MDLDRFFAELKTRRMLGELCGGFLGMNGLGLVAVVLPETHFRPFCMAGGRAFRWPFSSITAYALLTQKRFFLSYEWSDAAQSFNLSVDDAEAFVLAEGMHPEHSPSLRRRILSLYELSEPNPKQMLPYDKLTTPSWHAHAFIPSEECMFISGGGAPLPYTGAPRATEET